VQAQQLRGPRRDEVEAPVHLFEGAADMVEKGLAGRRQGDAVAVALEQRHAEGLLQLAHRVADGTRGEIELARRVLERTAARGGLERADGGERNRWAHRADDAAGASI
jgi:hypothetical protein